MIFKHRKICPCPVKYNCFPEGLTAGNIPGSIDSAAFLPGTVGFQIGFCHHIDSGCVAAVVPGHPIRIMAGAHGIDIVAKHAGNQFGSAGARAERLHLLLRAHAARTEHLEGGLRGGQSAFHTLDPGRWPDQLLLAIVSGAAVEIACGPCGRRRARRRERP